MSRGYCKKQKTIGGRYSWNLARQFFFAHFFNPASISGFFLSVSGSGRATLAFMCCSWRWSETQKSAQNRAEKQKSVQIERILQKKILGAAIFEIWRANDSAHKQPNRNIVGSDRFKLGELLVCRFSIQSGEKRLKNLSNTRPQSPLFLFFARDSGRGWSRPKKPNSRPKDIFCLRPKKSVSALTFFWPVA